MFEAYITTAMTVMFIAAIASVCLTILWRIDHGRRRSDDRKFARTALLAYASIPGAFLWPVAIPAAILYIISRLVNDANLPNN